jgi:hypothetical protein
MIIGDALGGPINRFGANAWFVRLDGKESVMHNYSSILVVVGSLCLMITLGLAWCLAGVRSSAFMKTLFKNYQYLLKAHIDYLLMTGLLMIFFLLFNHFRVLPSPLVVFAMSVGSFMNPVGFIALAIKPDLSQRPTSPFGAVMTGSFTLTTIGYAGAAWSIGVAALRGV